jgi:peroxiredoxin
MSKTPALNEQIAQTVAAFMSQLPPDTTAVVGGSFEKLAASHVAEDAKNVGEIAPDFRLPNATGRPVSLYGELNNGPVVLSFYRGGWCPFCSLELQALQGILPEIHSRGASLIGISPEKPDNSLTTAEKYKLEFQVLSDQGNRTAREYGLLFTVYEEMRPLYLEWGFDVPSCNGDASWELPVPATYIIDTNAVVRTAFIDKDYTRRMEPDDIIAALNEIQ